MNKELWDKIERFDFDSPPSEYDFSTRLANENFWTKSFAAQAILEYKKFMYLAATSDFMISPSAIVDAVWHQHLIFTHSYQDFCNLMGRQIQHIPSTHSKEEYLKFQQAKERTARFYERDFGPQPPGIWNFGDMYESLNLAKANLNIRTFLNIDILAVICLTVPIYFLLKPLYLTIGNPYFIIGLAILAISIFLSLEFYNRFKLKEIVSSFNKDSFIYNLEPFELVYLQTQKLSNIINGTVNELIENGAIDVRQGNKIELTKNGSTINKEQLQVTSSLSQLGITNYRNLLRLLNSKPIFGNTANCMDAFKKYFNKSKKFGQIFYLNFVILSIIVLCSFTRIATGVLREKPVTEIIFATIVLTIIVIAFLKRLTNQICTTTIPELYKDEILPNSQIKNNWQWSYFLSGTAVLAASFVPLVNYIDRNTTDGDSSSSGSSCGSNCGSSCGSCGGCGGD
jgi:hypothetical protein